MNQVVYLSLVLHNHQPIGNFDGVIEQAYRDSYLPFLEVFEPYQDLQIALHTSGPLMLWLAENHPDYIDRLRQLVAAGRVEIVGGPFYEPILTMLPSRDRIGQIRRYSDWLQAKFDTSVNGMWMPERVWESQLTRDIAATSIQYTILDDFHFRSAGWNNDSLTGYFITEDDGQILRVFPGSEKLRYLIPFAPAEDTIQYCREIATKAPGSILVFGDDGEKFGTWPDTKAHVYERGWLRSFFDALQANRHWLKTTTPSQFIAAHPPQGTIFLPDCSYREMTEWSLPVEQQVAYDDVVHDFHNMPEWGRIQRFMRGGFWRNFRVKYTEANEMYCRMLEVSRRLELARRHSVEQALVPQAENHLYRGQCNCPYWHGAFGGIYLPHLRNATFRELIAADNLLERAEGRDGSWVDVVTEDFNKDLFPEVRLSNEFFAAYVAPAQGGMLYELDVREIQHNLLATLQRRPESYHRKVLAGSQAHQGETASIHDRVVFKQAGLERRLQYYRYPKKSFLELFLDERTTSEHLANGNYQGLPTSVVHNAKLRRGTEKIQLQMHSQQHAWGISFELTKALTIEAGSNALIASYLFEGLPPGRPLHFASEWNFAGMPSGADDRFFYDSQLQRLGQLGNRLDQQDSRFLGLIDQYLGLDVQLAFSRPTQLWTFPVETVSQSEGGFELVHQSVCVVPHWTIQGDVAGRWSVQMVLKISHNHQPTARTEEFAFLVGT
jgi:4-alpha-glucanotransferase